MPNLGSGSDPLNSLDKLSQSIILNDDERKRRYQISGASVSAVVRLSPEPEELVESCHQIMGGQLLYIITDVN